MDEEIGPWSRELDLPITCDIPFPCPWGRFFLSFVLFFFAYYHWMGAHADMCGLCDIRFLRGSDDLKTGRIRI